MKSQLEQATRCCGVCGSTAPRELYTAKDRLRNCDESFSIVRCEGCGVLKTLPEMDDDELARTYADHY